MQVLALSSSFVALVLVAAPAGAQCEIQKLLSIGAEDSADYGKAVAVSGDVAVVGAPGRTTTGEMAGEAYVYRRVGGVWQLETTLIGDDTIEDDQFGWAVDVEGDVIVVGAPFHDTIVTDAGAAYVFHFDGEDWQQVQQLAVPTPEPDEAFGLGLGLEGGELIVGSPHHGGTFIFDPDALSGWAYAFRWNGATFTYIEDIPPPVIGFGDRFGSGYAFSGDRVVITAETGGPAVNEGTAYVFQLVGESWVFETELVDPAVEANDVYGTGIGYDGAFIVAGAPGDDDQGSFAGAVYVWEFDGVDWTLEDKLYAPDAEAGEMFGDAVGLVGDTLIVGASEEEDLEGVVGAVFVFRRIGDAWVFEEKIRPTETTGFERYGEALDFDGVTALVGAPFAEAGAFRAGAAYPLREVAGSFDQEQVLMQHDYAAFHRYGESSTMGDGFFAVGTSRDDQPFGTGSSLWVSSGSVSVFRPDGEGEYELEVELASPNEAGGGQFGRSVGSSGSDLLIVGAPSENGGGIGDAGRAYVYRHDGTSWALEQELTASDGQASDLFGMGVAIDGDVAIVGATGVNAPTANEGAAYLFRRVGTSWVEVDKVTASDPQIGADFGEAVDILGDRALVGSIGTDAGYVYRDEGSSWAFEAKLSGSGVQSTDGGGAAVGLGADFAVVGGWLHEGAETDSGTAWIFRRTGTTWAEEDKLLPADAVQAAHFGWSIDVLGDRIAVGAEGDTNGAVVDAGSAYVYAWNGAAWVEEQKFLPSTAESEAQFGYSVALGPDLFVAGAYAEFALGPLSGAAYVFGPEVDPVLAADPPALSLASGGTIDLELEGGVCTAGQVYLVLGSLSGTVPGLPLGGVGTLPLNYDFYLEFLLLNPNVGPLSDTLGFLDFEGQATATVQIAPGLPAFFAGLTLNHAALLFTADTLDIVAVTNAAGTSLVP